MIDCDAEGGPGSVEQFTDFAPVATGVAEAHGFGAEPGVAGDGSGGELVDFGLEIGESTVEWLARSLAMQDPPLEFEFGHALDVRPGG